MELQVIIELISAIRAHIDTAKDNSEVAKSLKQHLEIIGKILNALKSSSSAQNISQGALKKLDGVLKEIERFLAGYKIDGQWYDFLKLLKAKGHEKKLSALMKDLFDGVAELTLGLSAEMHDQLHALTLQLQANTNALEAAFRADFTTIQRELETLKTAAEQEALKLQTIVEHLESLGQDVLTQSTALQENLSTQRQLLETTQARIADYTRALDDLALGERLTAISTDITEMKAQLARIEEGQRTAARPSGLEMKVDVDSVEGERLGLTVGGSEDLTFEQHAQRQADRENFFKQASTLNAERATYTSGATRGEVAVRLPKEHVQLGIALASSVAGGSPPESANESTAASRRSSSSSQTLFSPDREGLQPEPEEQRDKQTLKPVKKK